MKAALARRIERNVDYAASALFAGSVALAAFTYWSRMVPEPTLAAYAGAIGVLAYSLCLGMLRSLERKAHFPVSVFDVRQIEPAVEDELLLSDADRLQSAGPAADGALELDDILAELAPDSRVVRLFDPSAMPTPGQLKARIDRHIDHAPTAPGTADASQALSDALAELRRSLR